MDQLVDARRARGAGGEDERRGAGAARQGPRARGAADRRRQLRPLRRAHRQPDPEPPFWGVREIPVDLDEVYHHLDTPRALQAPLGRPRREGRGLEGALDEDFQPRLERMWREQDYLHPRALLGYFPCYREGNEDRRARPRGPRDGAERLVFPRQPKHDRICLADFYRPKDPRRAGRRRDQAVTAGAEVTELMAELEADGEFAEQLFVHGLGVQTAEGIAEWLHSQVRARPRHRRRPGPALLVGLPGVPGPDRAREGRRLLDARADRHAHLRRLRASSPSSRRSRSSPTTRRRSTSA